MPIVLKCHACGAPMSFESLVGRRDECPKCGADAHACKNCRHYDRAAYNECKEPQAEVTREKDRANFCDFFEPGSAAGSGADDARRKAMAAAEALFKKK